MEHENNYISPIVEIIKIDPQLNLCMVTSEETKQGTQDLYDGGNTDSWF